MTEQPMDTLTAILIVEGAEPASEERTASAWQYLIDTDIAWQLQGYHGRTAARMIEEGTCKPAPEKRATS
jgi:hypothetical protein